MESLILLIVGLGLLTAGAEALVRGGSSLARHLGLTPLVIGLTVVAFGTSTPETIVSVGGSLQGHDDIAVGNIIGSNIFNVGLILGVCALVSPIAIQLGILKLDAPLVLALSVLAAVVVILGEVSRGLGILFLVLLFGYTAWSIWLARKQTSELVGNEFETGVPKPTRSLKIDGILIVSGLACLMIGSKFLVKSSIDIAHAFGVSEAVIGLTIVAAGTSMPECATSLVAALRKQSDIAIGNILGSNTFNILGILGLSAVAKPLQAPNILPSDLYVMVGFALVMLPLFWTGRSLQRWEGGLLLAGYVTYVWSRWP